MKSIFLILLTLMISKSINAQHENDIWFFGGNNAGMLFNHAFGGFQSYSLHKSLNNEGCGVATDPAAGQLLFYTDGDKIYDRNHDLMADNLGGSPSCAQAVAFIPEPGGCNSYYVFSNSRGGTLNGQGDVYLATIDMSANSGLGALSTSNVLVRSNVNEGMLTIAKPGSNDFWLVGTDNNAGSTFYVYAVTKNGISLHSEPNIGPVAYSYGISYTEKGGMIAASYPNSSIVYAYKFDAVTGTLSAPKMIDNQTSAYDSEWSADGTKLYYSNWFEGPHLRQYDFGTGVITPIATGNDPDWHGGGLKIGLDNAIYYISDRSSTYLSRIAYPDLPGLACGYQANYIDLGSNIHGLNLPVTLTPVFTPPGCIRPHWEAQVISVNGYIEPAEPWCAVITNGQAQIAPANVDTSYYWSHFTATMPQDALISGDITLECRIKNEHNSGGIDAYDVTLSMNDGFKGASVNFVGTMAAVSYTGINFNNQAASGLPSLVTDLSDWRLLRLRVTPTELNAYVDGNLVYTLPHTGSLCWLSQFAITTKGSGIMDWVRLYDGAGQEIYFEDFSSATEFACLNAPKAEENYINRYAAVENICGNWLEITDPGAFAPGDTVLIIQMKGATVDTSESPACGTILSYGNAGHYEMNIVAEIQGQQLLLKNKILNTYDVPGKVQLIYVPWLGNSTIGCYTCPAWNGATGGVLAFTGGEITLDGDLSVSGKGFRGGAFANFAQDDCLTNPNRYHFPAIAIDSAGAKGEGLAITPDSLIRGRGALGNAGGGGNAHNYGGGTGGNGGPGGNGGKYTFDCHAPDYEGGGFGGFAVYRDNTLINNRAIMGGGGGAGHSNNGKGSAGGNGGGIVLAWVDRLVSNGYAILTNGQNAPIHPSYPANNDGGGGGGAGGSIMLHLKQGVTGRLDLIAKGGNGASVEYRHGHGGGGGGGVAWVNSWPSGNMLAATLTGGRSGVGINGLTNGATNGGNGIVLTGLNIPFSHTLFDKLRLASIETHANCDGTATIEAIALGGGANPTFSLNGNVWTPVGIFSGLPASTLQLWATDGCSTVDTLIKVSTFQPVVLDMVTTEPQLCQVPGSLLAKASGGAQPLFYILDGQVQSHGYFEPLEAANYQLIVTDSIGCQVSESVDLDDLSYTIPVEALDTVEFIYGSPVLLMGSLPSGADTTGLTWSWSPLFRIDCPSCQKTLAHPSEDLIYKVQVIDDFGCTGTANTFAKLIGTDVYRPNIFGLNQRDFYFSCDETVLEIMYFQVYDRWGSLMVEKKNMAPDAILWDGTTLGKTAMPGVYVYKAILKLTSGLQLEIKGDITFMGH